MSNRPTGAAYDKIDTAESMLPRQHVTAFGVNGTLLGTVASTASLADLFIVPANSNIKVSGASMKITTGGTGTGATTSPKWGIGHSLAGTGANSVFGTALFGTRADGTYLNFSLTTTDVPAGNVVRLVAIAGTTDQDAQIGGYVSLEYKEDWD